jgi:hypothetical protein
MRSPRVRTQRHRFTLGSVLGTALVVLPLLGACASTRGELEPRYVTVHNAFAAMGMAQVGPLHQGSLSEGKEQRIKLDLAAQCTTIVALGNGGARDVDIALLDDGGKVVAKDATKDTQAVLRACVESKGSYTLVVKMAQGSGDFVVATWSGGAHGGGDLPAGGSGPNAQLAQGAGTCESPIGLAAGTVNGNTQRGESENQGSCGSSDSKELVYKLDVPKKQRVQIEVDPRFDAVLYVRRDECAESDSEVACNDDAGGKSRRSSSASLSRIDQVLDPGSYYVFVDGYGSESGSFRMTTTLTDVPTLADACQRARVLGTTPVSGATQGTFDHASASCGDDAKGPDTVSRLDVAQRSRVRITHHSDDFSPVVHVRKTCTDDKSEVGCSNSGATDEDATFVGTLDPGSYYVFADSSDKEADGHFSLTAELSPEAGSGATGDACADAITLGTDASIEGDTFTARDDVAGKCGGAGAPDVVYRVDIPRRERFTAHFSAQEGKHLFALTRACGDRSTEIACGSDVDEVLAPGTYFLAVDGAAADQFGKFTFDWRTVDISGQEAACRGAPALADGQTVNGNNGTGPHRFTLSCAGRDDTQTSPDRVYKIAVNARTHVRLSLATPTWEGAIAIRRACIDPAHGGGPRGAEAACNARSEDSHHARIDTWLEPGTYFVVVGGRGAGAQGAYTLEYRVVK